MTADEKQNAVPQLVDAARFRELTAQAAAAPRKRSHLLLHSGPDDLVQRLIISAQPGTYFRPHQHSRQWEMLILQRGCIDILTFGNDGEVQSRSTLDRMTPIMEMPVAAWHTCIVREPDTVVVEIKPGPQLPNEFAAWAPEEGHEQTAEFLRWATSAQTGQRWPQK
jgi:cupin fold WbuC family metalloprotein